MTGESAFSECAQTYSMECPACNVRWQFKTGAEEIARKVDAALHWSMNHDGPIPDDAPFGKHQCPNCLDVVGLNGTVSCSECGYIPEAYRDEP